MNITNGKESLMPTIQQLIPPPPLELFAPELETKLQDILHVYSFAAGETIFAQGETAGAIYLIASGTAKIVRVTKKGFESILCVRGPGDYFCPVPILDGGCHLGTAVAMSDVTLYACEGKQFSSLCQSNPELLAAVQKDCLPEVRHLLNRLESLAFRSIKERLAITLLDQRRFQLKTDGSPNEIHLTQKELAAHIGASRERVSKTLKNMEREGILTLKRGSVTLHDIERLQRLSRI
jgi:CRP-like cAMP-binding protein